MQKKKLNVIFITEFLYSEFKQKKKIYKKIKFLKEEKKIYTKIYKKLFKKLIYFFDFNLFGFERVVLGLFFKVAS